MKYSVLIIILIGLGLRIGHLQDRDLSGDEKETLLEANGIGYHISFSPFEGFRSSDFQDEKTFRNVISALIDRDSGNGVVYMSALYFWLQITGNSNWLLRLISLIFSVLTIYAVYLLSKEIFEDDKIAFFGALAFAVHEVAVKYGQEARPYAMSVFFITLSALFFFKIVKNNNRQVLTWVAAYGLASAGALLCHYFSSFMLIAQLVIAMLFVREFYKWKALLFGAVIVSLFMVIWMVPNGLEGLRMMSARSANYQHLSSIDPKHTFYGALEFSNGLGGMLQMVVHSFGIGFQNAGLRIIYNVVFLIIPVLLIVSNLDYLKSNKNIFVSLLVFIFITPIIALGLAIKSGYIISFQVLYTNFSIPFCSVFIGVLIAISLKKKTWSNIFLICSYSAILILSNLPTVFLDREYLSGSSIQITAEELEMRIGQEDTLFLSSMSDAFELNPYFKREDIMQKVDSARGQSLIQLSRTYH